LIANSAPCDTYEVLLPRRSAVRASGFSIARGEAILFDDHRVPGPYVDVCSGRTSRIRGLEFLGVYAQVLVAMHDIELQQLLGRWGRAFSHSILLGIQSGRRSSTTGCTQGSPHPRMRLGYWRRWGSPRLSFERHDVLRMPLQQDSRGRCSNVHFCCSEWLLWKMR